MQRGCVGVFESNRINLVVAHSVEAKPLCAVFNLRAVVHKSPFPLFHNAKDVSLIVSGMGKVSAAAATAYLAGLQAAQPACAWLNLGIAGHQTAAIGTGLLAHKVTDAASRMSFYPPQLLQGFMTSEVISVDKPEHQYPQDAAYDMEAAGFYASASSVVTSELVHVFKVISDNPQHPLARFEISKVAALLSSQQTQLEKLLEKMCGLLDVYRTANGVSDEYEILLSRYHLTASQRVQLKRYCERYQALKLGEELSAISATEFSTSRQLLETLEKRISLRAGS